MRYGRSPDTKYIEHTVIDSLAPLGPGEAHRFIRAGMDQDEKILAAAPALLRELFARDVAASAELRLIGEKKTAPIR